MSAVIASESIDGSRAYQTTFLKPIGDRLRRCLTPHIPRFVETWHLTLVTIPLSILVVFFGFRARVDVTWIWAISGAVLLQYVADVLDGELGRQRGTGLVRWGFYLDHLSDAAFIAAVICAYMFIYPQSIVVLVAGLLVSNMLFLHEALACIGCGKYNRYGHHRLGLEEGRALILLLNSIITFARPSWLHLVFVGMVMFLGLLLVEQVLLTQRRLWNLDLKGRDPRRS